ncbi:hypothetical protein CW731_00200 [Polaribacter sp. ALD11]|uniref:hypothetical protein n=1 Tax=Polaribacter sp. ALD11 TaxID=2058137 RepID=UPI000C302619|nr:hypothetical protein [Polaribacter sp. ALD11]AUC83804.1 hypothetical protein CW731_00200 [Polaribacter sp. ALD11]
MSICSFSQKKNTDTLEIIEKVTNKGKFFVYWGWNRANYSNSDIHFTGDNYDFTLQNVKAKDRQTPFSFNDYFNPGRITIPQNNYRIGYFLKENYTISIGVDHMKYVMVADQTVKIDGEINSGTPFDGVYNNDDRILSKDFLQLEHTDGLNYVNVEFRRFDEIGHLIGLNHKNFQINLTEGFGAGILYPRTDVTLFNQERHDEFHIAGWGASAVVGLNLTFFKYFYIQSDLKLGYINLPDVRTTINPNDGASQSFYFFQKNILIGGKFRIF